jgi:hypothetical protein
MSDSEWRRRIEREERIRHEARENIAYDEARQEERYRAKLDRHEAHVSAFGNMGAAKVTLLKWVIGGFVLTLLAAFGSDGPVNFSGLATFFGLFVVIGLWRAFYFLRF